jgi:hypothetical protein
MRVERYNGTASPPFPSDWWVDSVHDHTSEPPVWTVVVYYRKPGGRFPIPVKLIREQYKENKRSVVKRQQLVNDSRPQRGGTGG